MTVVVLTPLLESAGGVEGLLGVVAVVPGAASPEYLLLRGVFPLLITQNANRRTRKY